MAGTTGTINLAWSLAHTNTGSYYVRMAAPEGQTGQDISISGSQNTIATQTGTPRR